MCVYAGFASARPANLDSTEADLRGVAGAGRGADSREGGVMDVVVHIKFDSPGEEDWAAMRWSVMDSDGPKWTI
jgi:hypothetical protein